jgi:hypothetical protein
MEARDRVADGGQHSLDLMLSAFMEAQLDPGWAQAPGARGGGGAVVEVDSRAQALQVLVGRLALDVGLVDLLHAVPRVGEPVREVTVVREEERARRVGVEAADRDDAGRVVDEVDDGRATLRIAHGRDRSGRLV